MLQRDGGLRDGVHGQGGGTGGVRPAEDEDGARNLCAPQAKRLGKICHGKRRRAPGLQQLRHSRVAMAIGIGLHHGHHGRAARRGLHQPEIFTQRVQAHLCPAVLFQQHTFPLQVLHSAKAPPF